MKKLLRRRDFLLLGLAGIVDVFNDLKDPLDITRNSYRNLYGWVPSRFKKTHYYQSVCYGLRTGYIEKVIKNNKPFLRLTAKGAGKVARDFSLTDLQNKKWDEKWRVVIFDIKEKERRNRDLLRLKLKELGFGMIQESVWISPYDVALDFREFVKSVGLGDQVYIMEANHLLAGDLLDLAAKIWPLGKITEKYNDLVKDIKNLHDRVKNSTNSEGENQLIMKGELNELRLRYFEILKEDPCLPKELLPDDWGGKEVKKLLKV